MRLLLINGPNLNLLGQREPSLYGPSTLKTIEADLVNRAKSMNVELETFQSNSESELIERIHHALGSIHGILINAGAFTHTSIAIRDALLATKIPFVEVHLSNIHAREAFRQQSFLADCAIGGVLGFGEDSYQLALQGLIMHLNKKNS